MENFFFLVVKHLKINILIVSGSQFLSSIEWQTQMQIMRELVSYEIIMSKSRCRAGLDIHRLYILRLAVPLP